MAIEERSSFRLGEWLVVPSLHRISRVDDVRQLEPKVMRVLVCLASRPGEVVGHDELIEEVWGGVAVSSNVVTYSIAALRKALEDDWRAPSYVETISKSGYRLIMPVSAADADDVPPAAAGSGSPLSNGAVPAVDVADDPRSRILPPAIADAGAPVRSPSSGRRVGVYTTLTTSRSLAR